MECLLLFFFVCVLVYIKQSLLPTKKNGCYRVFLINAAESFLAFSKFEPMIVYKSSGCMFGTQVA